MRYSHAGIVKVLAMRHSYASIVDVPPFAMQRQGHNHHSLVAKYCFSFSCKQTHRAFPVTEANMHSVRARCYTPMTVADENIAAS